MDPRNQSKIDKQKNVQRFQQEQQMEKCPHGGPHQHIKTFAERCFNPTQGKSETHDILVIGIICQKCGKYTSYEMELLKTSEKIPQAEKERILAEAASNKQLREEAERKNRMIQDAMRIASDSERIEFQNKMRNAGTNEERETFIDQFCASMLVKKSSDSLKGEQQIQVPKKESGQDIEVENTEKLATT